MGESPGMEFTMSFRKFAITEKPKAVKPADNAKLNKLAAKLDTISKTSKAGRPCGCSEPCGDCD